MILLAVSEIGQQASGGSFDINAAAAIVVIQVVQLLTSWFNGRKVAAVRDEQKVVAVKLNGHAEEQSKKISQIAEKVGVNK